MTEKRVGITANFPFCHPDVRRGLNPLLVGGGIDSSYRRNDKSCVGMTEKLVGMTANFPFCHPDVRRGLLPLHVVGMDSSYRRNDKKIVGMTKVGSE